MPLLKVESKLGRLKGGVLTALAAAVCFISAKPTSAAEMAVIGAAASAEQAVEFNVYLPLRDRDGAESLLRQLHDPNSASYHQWLTPAQFSERFGPQTATVNAITKELKAHGLEVTDVHSHSLHVSGAAGGVKSAFGTSLAMAQFTSGKQVMTASAPLHLTPALQAAGAVVADFSGKIRVQKTAHPSNLVKPQNRESSTGGSLSPASRSSRGKA